MPDPVAGGQRVRRMRLSALMGKAKPLNDRIHRASWLAARARVDLDLFAFLTHQTNLDRFEDVLGERWTLFEFIRTAHEHAFWRGS